MSNGKTKRVLIITYYWPPSGGAPVQRWLKFAKYLERFGWQPVIYTPENPESFYDDESLMRDVPKDIEIVKSHIWEPYDIYRMLTGKKGEKIAVGFTSADKKKGVFHSLLMWLRGNLLIPDPRIFWVNPSVRFLKKYLKENPVDVVVTTGPPHSLHLIGLKLKRKLKVRWLADFRDPWTNIDFYGELHLSRLADYIHHKLERKVISNADVVTVVSNQIKNDFGLIGKGKIEVITNGFDDDDWLDSRSTQQDSNFSIVYAGTLTATRNPIVLWPVLRQLCTELPEFSNKLKIKIAGQVDAAVLKSIEDSKLIDHCILLGQLSHKDVIKLQLEAQVLLLVVNNTPNARGIVTGKFFEYLAAGRRIITVGPSNGDLAEMLELTGTGDVVDFDDFGKAKQVITKYFQLYIDGKINPDKKNVSQFSRKELTCKLAEILDKVKNEK